MTYIALNFQPFDNELRQSSAAGTRSAWSFFCEENRKLFPNLGLLDVGNRETKKSTATTKAAFSALGKAQNELVALTSKVEQVMFGRNWFS